MEIKCVFQGGGAKVATLLLLAEILEEMGAEVTVTEVAGTSAGSIAAFALASEFPIKDVRDRIRIHGASIINEFRKKPNFWRLMLAIFLRRSIYSERTLRHFFRLIFPGKGKKRLKLSHALLPIHIRTADLLAGLPKTYRREDDINVDKALADSCAIPFALRSHASDRYYVDGGIVSNLVEPSVFGNPPSGNIIAFTFEKSEQDDPAKLKDYLAALASTVIDSNVEESVGKIVAAGGEVCILPNHFTTFEFGRALDEGMADTYIETHRAEIKSRIQKSVEILRFRTRLLQPDTNFANSVMGAMLKERPISVVKNSVICVAESFDQPNAPDRLTKRIMIEPQKDGIFAFKIGILRNEAYELGNDLNWEIFDKDDNPLEAIQGVIQSVRDGEVVWHSCFVLKELLPKAMAPLKIVLNTSHRGLMAELLKPKGTEWMRAESGQDDLVEIQDLVLMAPKKAGSFGMSDLVSGLHRTVARPSKEKDMIENWSPGTSMNSAELAPYNTPDLRSRGYQAIGWRTTGMRPGTYAGALIERLQ